MIRIVIVHRTRLIASLLASLIDDEEDMHVSGYATTGEEALRSIPHCNVMLVSASLPESSALDLTREVVQRGPSPKVLITDVSSSKDKILRYVEAGAFGYVLRHVTPADMLEVIRAAYNDEALVSPDVAAAMIERLSELSILYEEDEKNVDISAELTAREHEVLDLIVKGRTNQQIAVQLVIEIGTVKNHVHNILTKLDVANRREAAAMAVRQQYLDS